MLYAVLVLQALFTLSGTITDVELQRIPAAHVTLQHTTGQTVWQAQSGPDGTFEFERLPLGSYNITVQCEGYFDFQSTLRLDAGTVLEITLVPVAVLEQSVDVVARPHPIAVDATSAQQHVDDQVIQNIPTTNRRSFDSAVALMPGVVRDNTGALHIHGSRPNQVRYQLDGIEINDPGTGALGSNIPVDAIESIDVDLAGYSAEFGRGSGGVVRVNSQFVDDTLKWDVTDFIPGINFKRGTLADFSPRFLLAGPIVRGKAWFMYSGNIRYIRTFKDDMPEGQNRQSTTVADQLLKLHWNLGESHILTMTLLSNSEYYGNVGLGRNRPVETTSNVLRRGTTAAVSNRNIVNGAILETTVQWSHRRDTDLAKGTEPFRVTPEGWSGNYYADRRGRTDRFRVAQTMAWERRIGSILHRFKAGAEFDYVIADLHHLRRPFQVYDAAGELNLDVDFEGQTFASIRNQQYGIFIQDRLVLSPALQLEVGLRVDRESVVGRTLASPRLAASYLPFGSERSKISGGIGIFHDTVPLEHLLLPRLQYRTTTSYMETDHPVTAAATGVSVSPELRNPFGVHWNVSWEQEWATRWVTRINFVRKRGYDQLRLAARPDPAGLQLEFNNSGSAAYHSLELSLDRPIREGLRFLGSYIYSRATERPSLSMDFPDPGLEAIDRAVTPWDSPHRFVGWGYFPFILDTTGAFSIEARAGFPFSAVDELGQVAGSYHQFRYPAHVVVNASIEKELPIIFGRRMALLVGVTNLFNRFNPRFVDNNIHSPGYMTLSDSSNRHLYARVRLLD